MRIGRLAVTCIWTTVALPVAICVVASRAKAQQAEAPVAIYSVGAGIGGQVGAGLDFGTKESVLFIGVGTTQYRGNSGIRSKTAFAIGLHFFQSGHGYATLEYNAIGVLNAYDASAKQYTDTPLSGAQLLYGWRTGDGGPGLGLRLSVGIGYTSNRLAQGVSPIVPNGELSITWTQ